jgi:prepilin-type processing-associated H-X9-DG protein
MKLPSVRFTIRQMMMAVALLATLTAMSVFVQRSSEAAQRKTCEGNLKQIALGLINYSGSYESFPAGTIANDRLPPERRLSWLAAVYGYIEQWGWLLDLSEPWDSSTNCPTRGRGVEGEPQVVGRLPLLTCPAAAGAADDHMPGWTWYVGVAGVGRDAPELPDRHPRAGVFGYNRRTTRADISDGLSTTMMLAETASANGPWTAGGPATVRGLNSSQQPYVGRGRQFGGTHGSGANVAFADGSVRFLSESIDPKVFEGLATIAGGETLPAGWDR